VAVITKLVKGYDPDYPFRQQGRRAGDYFDVRGEPRGRWWGSGAAVLGLAPGSEVDRKTHRMMIAEHLDPRDGKTRLGRAPGNAAARAEALYQEKLKAEPHAQAAVRAAARGRAGGAAGPGLLRGGQLVLQDDHRVLGVARGEREDGPARGQRGGQKTLVRPDA